MTKRELIQKMKLEGKVDPNIKIIMPKLLIDFVMQTKGNIIQVGNKWIKLLRNDETVVWDAYFLTVGHELAHMQPETKTKFDTKNKNEKRFVNWCREIYCDFAGCAKMGNSKRERLVEAWEFKRTHIKQQNPRMSHPSPSMRLSCAKKYDFDRALICKIAQISGCKSQELIDEMAKNYPTIVLK